MNLSQTLVGFVLALCVSTVSADWVVVGVAYSCDLKTRTLDIVSTLETSQAPGHPDIPPGFRPLKYGETTIRCPLPGASLTAKFILHPPLERGTCRGIGTNNFYGLRLNGKVVVKPELFGDGCFFEDTLATLEVTPAKAGFILKKCYVAELGDIESRENLKCSVARQ